MTTKKNELQRLVAKYYNDKQDFDNLKTLLDETNNKIKDRFEELGLDEVTYQGLKATVSTSTRVSMDESRLLFLLENCELNNAKGLIKTRKYVDMDVLEDMIYHNDIPANILKRIGECKSEKEVKTLRITRVKK